MMNSTLKLSIVIPIYNVEKYLAKCLDSCLNQSINNYEIIAVNDGSNDGSFAILQEYAAKYHIIRVVSQENQGLSMARNNGLAVAKGEYIWFIDSDDWIEEGCLKNIFPKLKDNIDLLQLQYRYVYDDESQNHDASYSLVEGCKTGREVIRNGGLSAPAPFTIYRRKFLIENRLSFVSGIYHEDSEFKPRATYLAEKITSIDLVCYNYYQRSSGSITSSFRMKNAVDIIKVMNSLYDFSRGFIKEEIVAFNKFISLDMNTLLYGYRNLSASEQKQVCSMLKNEKHLFRCMANSKNFKYKLEGICFGLSIRLGFFLHNCLR